MDEARRNHELAVMAELEKHGFEMKALGWDGFQRAFLVTAPGPQPFERKFQSLAHIERWLIAEGLLGEEGLSW